MKAKFPRALLRYEAKSEVEGGYLTVQRGQVLEIMRSSRTPCEAGNTPDPRT